MEFKITYTSLFDVEILHDYFLNEGEADFSTMDALKQKKRLRLYDMSSFITVTPSQETLKKLKGHHLVFKTHKSGFRVYAKIAEGTTNVPFVRLRDDLNLTFVLKLNDALFGNYTDLTLGSQHLFFFGNTKPATEGASFKYIPKSNENTRVSEAFRLSEDGSKAICESLEGQNKIGVFGVVSLTMIADTAELNLLTVQGKLRVQPQVFKLQFQNRQTYWRYLKMQDSTEIFTTPSTKPLTKYGFIEIVHEGETYPNPNANQLNSETNTYFSELYI